MVFRILLADLSHLLVGRVIPPSANGIDAVVLVTEVYRQRDLPVRRTTAAWSA
jgi:hypothetical protein